MTRVKYYNLVEFFYGTGDSNIYHRSLQVYPERRRRVQLCGNNSVGQFGNSCPFECNKILCGGLPTNHSLETLNLLVCQTYSLAAYQQRQIQTKSSFMIKSLPGEQWKTITFDFEFTNEGSIQISNFGRLRTFNKLSAGNIVNGSMINGYRIIRLKLYRPREEKMQTRLNFLQQQVFKLARKLKSLKENKESKKNISETETLLNSLKQNLSKKFGDDLKERTINYHSLVHRLVADYFLKKPTAKQTIVAHLDYDKLNNRATNLKWMTPEENYEHQKKSPYVIKDKQERRSNYKRNAGTAKLTVTKVMLLKKMLNQGKPMKQLVKQFKITDTQIFRIKRGENWADIQAATN